MGPATNTKRSVHASHSDSSRTRLCLPYLPPAPRAFGVRRRSACVASLRLLTLLFTPWPVHELSKSHDLPFGKVNKCMIALVAAKHVVRRSENVRCASPSAFALLADACLPARSRTGRRLPTGPRTACTWRSDVSRLLAPVHGCTACLCVCTVHHASLLYHTSLHRLVPRLAPGTCSWPCACLARLFHTSQRARGTQVRCARLCGRRCCVLRGRGLLASSATPLRT